MALVAELGSWLVDVFIESLGGGGFSVGWVGDIDDIEGFLVPPSRDQLPLIIVGREKEW